MASAGVLQKYKERIKKKKNKQNKTQKNWTKLRWPTDRVDRVPYSFAVDVEGWRERGRPKLIKAKTVRAVCF